jgi:hypothetical protein
LYKCIQEFIGFVRQQKEDSEIQPDQQEEDPTEMEPPSDRVSVPLDGQEFVRFVKNEECEPKFQPEQEEEDAND